MAHALQAILPTMPPATVLIVDDDQANLESVTRIFQREGLETLGAKDGKEGLELLRRPEVRVLVTDLMMPVMDGQELLRAARAVRPDVEVVLMTAYGTVETAVAAMKDGAYDFITKPLKRHALVKSVEKALEKQALVAENRDLKARLAAMGASGTRSMVGQSAAFRAFLDLLEQAAPSSATVLLLGESGTGKELAARRVHELSPAPRPPSSPSTAAPSPRPCSRRSSSAWSAAPIPARSPAARGASSGPTAEPCSWTRWASSPSPRRCGCCACCRRESCERLGGTQTLKVDVRVVAATNVDLRQRIAEKKFREDLYYRLNVVELRVPSLASRREDLPLLADHFLRRYAAKNAKLVRGFSPEALSALETYAWPGNVRELEHAVERAVVLCRGEVLQTEDLPEAVRQGPRGTASHVMIPIGTPLEEIERQALELTLRHTQDDKALAARLLGISVRTIYRKLGRQVTEDDAGTPPG